MSTEILKKVFLFLHESGVVPHRFPAHNMLCPEAFRAQQKRPGKTGPQGDNNHAFKRFSELFKVQRILAWQAFT